VAARPLPSDLARVLAQARAVELAATTRSQLREAIHATTGLIHRARAAGWTLVDLAPALGLKLRTVRHRVSAAPAPAELAGVEVTPAPPKLSHVPAPLPPEQREWLTSAEAMALAGIKAKMTLYGWRAAGLLPNTRLDAPGKGFLYSRSDIERVLAGPRNGRGVVRRSAEEHNIASIST
jgi:hypothetical protein